MSALCAPSSEWSPFPAWRKARTMTITMTMITRLVGSLYTKLGIEITGLDSPRLANCSHHDNVNDDDHSTGHPRKAENQSAVINWKMIFERCQFFPHASNELLDNTSLLWNTLGSKSGRLESSADNCQSSCRLSVHKNHTCPGSQSA